MPGAVSATTEGAVGRRNPMSALPPKADMQCNLACLLWAISGHLESRKNDIFLIWLRLSADRAAKAQEVAIRVFDGELAEAVRKILRTPFGLTASLNSGPQRIDVIDGEILGCRCARLSEMSIVHEHDGNAITT